MDPLSIAATLFSAIAKAVKLKKDLTQAGVYKPLPKEIDGLLDQISLSSTIVSNLAYLIQSNHDIIPAKTYTAIQDAVDGISKTLDEVAEELSRRLGGRTFLSISNWPKSRIIQNRATLSKLNSVLTSITQKILRDRIQLPNENSQSSTDPLLLDNDASNKHEPPDEDISTLQGPQSGKNGKKPKTPRIHGISGHSIETQTPTPNDNIELLLINDYFQRAGNKSKRYFNKLTFLPARSNYIHIEDLSSAPHEIPQMPFDPVVDLLDPNVRNNKVTPTDADAAFPLKFIRDKRPNKKVADTVEKPMALSLILCKVGIASSSHIPFTRQTFVKIMEEFKISAGLFQALFTGTPKFVLYENGETGSHDGCILRTPMSSTENWTVAISWDKHCQSLKGIFHGLLDHESDHFVMQLGDLRAELSNPMCVPVIVCEMLMESDSNGVKGRANDLYQVELRTNYHGYTRTNLSGPGELARSPEQDFEEMTRSLNIIISRLAFHEMRIHANMVFVDHILDFLKRKSEEDSYFSVWRTEWLQIRTKRLQERLKHLKTEQRALLLEITCNQKIAQSQLEIVYNLVAQRDNKDNLAMAAISTDIANTTKDDSFAMRTIAVMSIAFLPGTFVSSFFSMDMFDWQAPKGASVLSSRFWIYWAVTVPLTLVVFCTWFFWLRTHHKHDDQRRGRSPRQYVHDVRLPTAPLEGPKRPFRWLGRVRKHSDEEEKPGEDMELGTASAAEFSAAETLRRRQQAAPIGRADTVLQSPRR